MESAVALRTVMEGPGLKVKVIYALKVKVKVKVKVILFVTQDYTVGLHRPGDGSENSVVEIHNRLNLI